MKRTRATAKILSNGDQSYRNTSDTSTKAPSKIKDDAEIFQQNVVQYPKLKMKEKMPVNVECTDENHTNIEEENKQKRKNKLDLKRLRNRVKTTIENTDETKTDNKKKLRAIVDLEMMKEELKQLEDPPSNEREKKLSSTRLEYSFYDTPCEELAQNLLGKILVRCLENGTVLKGRIVETEGYLGTIDKASHTYRYKVTPRNMPMYMPPGTIYVYMTYGMYHCFNISSQGEGCAVLIRALEPLEGIDNMVDHRNATTKSKAAKRETKDFKVHELCNGPSKLCMAFQLEKCHSKYSLCTWKSLWIEDDVENVDIRIVQAKRVGIDSYGVEWANKPLRYYIYGNKSVSKRDKKAEALLGTDRKI